MLGVTQSEGNQDVAVAHPNDNDPVSRQSENILKIRISISEFAELDIEGRMRLIVGAISRDRNLRFSRGVGQFEPLLNSIGLGGSVPEDMTRAILEAQQMRHVIVHCGSVVDKDLVERCPWLDLKKNAPLNIGAEKYLFLTTMLVKYCTLIIQRAKGKYGGFES